MYSIHPEGMDILENWKEMMLTHTHARARTGRHSETDTHYHRVKTEQAIKFSIFVKDVITQQ